MSPFVTYRLPWRFSGKDAACNAGDIRDAASIPGLGRSAGGGYGNTFQYPFLENPMDRGAGWATVHGVTKSRTRLKQLSTHARYTWHFLILFSQDIKKAVFSEVEVGTPYLISREYFLLISLYLLNFRLVDSHCVAHTLCFPWYTVSRELS